MNIEYLGADAVADLFDIIAENYVSREEIANRDKELASSFSVGSSLIAAALLEVAKAVKTVQGGEGGGISDDRVATDEEVAEIIGQYFDF